MDRDMRQAVTSVAERLGYSPRLFVDDAATPRSAMADRLADDGGDSAALLTVQAATPTVDLAQGGHANARVAAAAKSGLTRARERQQAYAATHTWRPYNSSLINKKQHKLRKAPAAASQRGGTDKRGYVLLGADTLSPGDASGAVSGAGTGSRARFTVRVPSAQAASAISPADAAETDSVTSVTALREGEVGSGVVATGVSSTGARTGTVLRASGSSSKGVAAPGIGGKGGHESPRRVVRAEQEHRLREAQAAEARQRQMRHGQAGAAASAGGTTGAGSSPLAHGRRGVRPASADAALRGPASAVASGGGVRHRARAVGARGDAGGLGADFMLAPGSGEGRGGGGGNAVTGVRADRRGVVPRPTTVPPENFYLPGGRHDRDNLNERDYDVDDAGTSAAVGSGSVRDGGADTATPAAAAAAAAAADAEADKAALERYWYDEAEVGVYPPNMDARAAQPSDTYSRAHAPHFRGAAAADAAADAEIQRKLAAVSVRRSTAAAGHVPPRPESLWVVRAGARDVPAGGGRGSGGRGRGPQLRAAPSAHLSVPDSLYISAADAEALEEATLATMAAADVEAAADVAAAFAQDARTRRQQEEGHQAGLSPQQRRRPGSASARVPVHSAARPSSAARRERYEARLAAEAAAAHEAEGARIASKAYPFATVESHVARADADVEGGECDSDGDGGGGDFSSGGGLVGSASAPALGDRMATAHSGSAGSGGGGGGGAGGAAAAAAEPASADDSGRQTYYGSGSAQQLKQRQQGQRSRQRPATAGPRTSGSDGSAEAHTPDATTADGGADATPERGIGKSRGKGGAWQQGPPTSTGTPADSHARPQSAIVRSIRDKGASDDASRQREVLAGGHVSARRQTRPRPGSGGSGSNTTTTASAVTAAGGMAANQNLAQEQAALRHAEERAALAAARDREDADASAARQRKLTADMSRTVITTADHGHGPARKVRVHMTHGRGDGDGGKGSGGTGTGRPPAPRHAHVPHITPLYSVEDATAAAAGLPRPQSGRRSPAHSPSPSPSPSSPAPSPRSGSQSRSRSRSRSPGAQGGAVARVRQQVQRARARPQSAGARLKARPAATAATRAPLVRSQSSYRSHMRVGQGGDGVLHLLPGAFDGVGDASNGGGFGGMHGAVLHEWLQWRQRELADAAHGTPHASHSTVASSGNKGGGRFASAVLEGELQLRRAVVFSKHLGLPNPLVTAVSFAILDGIASLFGRYEPLLGQVRRHLLRAVYADAPKGVPLTLHASAVDAEGDPLSYSSAAAVADPVAAAEAADARVAAYYDTMTYHQRAALAEEARDAAQAQADADAKEAADIAARVTRDSSARWRAVSNFQNIVAKSRFDTQMRAMSANLDETKAALEAKQANAATYQYLIERIRQLPPRAKVQLLEAINEDPQWFVETAFKGLNEGVAGRLLVRMMQDHTFLDKDERLEVIKASMVGGADNPAEIARVLVELLLNVKGGVGGAVAAAVHRLAGGPTKMRQLKRMLFPDDFLSSSDSSDDGSGGRRRRRRRKGGQHLDAATEKQLSDYTDALTRAPDLVRRIKTLLQACSSRQKGEVLRDLVHSAGATTSVVFRGLLDDTRFGKHGIARQRSAMVRASSRRSGSRGLLLAGSPKAVAAEAPAATTAGAANGDGDGDGEGKAHGDAVTSPSSASPKARAPPPPLLRANTAPGGPGSTLGRHASASALQQGSPFEAFVDMLDEEGVDIMERLLRRRAKELGADIDDTDDFGYFGTATGGVRIGRRGSDGSDEWTSESDGEGGRRRVRRTKSLLERRRQREAEARAAAAKAKAEADAKLSEAQRSRARTIKLPFGKLGVITVKRHLTDQASRNKALAEVYELYEKRIAAVREDPAAGNESLPDFMNRVLVQKFGLPSIRDKRVKQILGAAKASVGLSSRCRMFCVMTGVAEEWRYSPRIGVVMLHLLTLLYPKFSAIMLTTRKEGLAFVTYERVLAAINAAFSPAHEGDEAAAAGLDAAVAASAGDGGGAGSGGGLSGGGGGGGSSAQPSSRAGHGPLPLRQGRFMQLQSDIMGMVTDYGTARARILEAEALSKGAKHSKEPASAARAQEMAAVLAAARKDKGKESAPATAAARLASLKGNPFAKNGDDSGDGGAAAAVGAPDAGGDASPARRRGTVGNRRRGGSSNLAAVASVAAASSSFNLKSAPSPPSGQGSPASSPRLGGGASAPNTTAAAAAAAAEAGTTAAVLREFHDGATVVPLDAMLNTVLDAVLDQLEEDSRALELLFDFADDDGNGVLSFAEFVELVRTCYADADDRTLISLFTELTAKSDDVTPQAFSVMCDKHGIMPPTEYRDKAAGALAAEQVWFFQAAPSDDDGSDSDDESHDGSGAGDDPPRSGSGDGGDGDGDAKESDDAGGGGGDGGVTAVAGGGGGTGDTAKVPATDSGGGGGGNGGGDGSGGDS